MRYTFFEIGNFKGIRALRLDLTGSPRGPVYTLVGLNESGKTTILEAINFFSYGTDDFDALGLTGYRRPDPHDLNPISERSNFNDSLTLRVGVELRPSDRKELADILKKQFSLRTVSFESDFVITEVYAFHDSRHVSEDASKKWSLKLYGKKKGERKEWELSKDIWNFAVRHLSRRMPKIWYFPNFLFEFPDRIYLEDRGDHDETTRDRHRFYRAILEDILATVDENATLDTHILARAKSGDKNDQRALDNLRLKMQRDVSSRIFTQWNAIFGQSIHGKQVRLLFDKDEAACWYASFQIEDADGYFSIRERSLGFRWFFVFLLITSYRGSRTSSASNFVFLFDEPASNLHSTAQSQLLKSFEKLADRCTIIYTTHSHHLINPAWLENTFVVRNAGLHYTQNDTQFTASMTDVSLERYREFVAKYPDQTTYFQPILDVLDYRPSRLENIPDIIMVEGKNDFYAILFVQQCCLEGAQLNCFPGGGSGSLDDVIGLYIAWARNFIVLLDSDAEGEKQKRRYIERFGALLEGRVFTLSDVDDEWKRMATEKLFSEEDRTRIVHGHGTDASIPPKKLFCRSIQEYVAAARRYDLTDASRERFTKLIEFLRKQLNEARK